MPVYTFEAKDSLGQTVSGEVNASDERNAAGRVRELGYYPMRVAPGGPAADSGLLSQPTASATLSERVAVLPSSPESSVSTGSGSTLFGSRDPMLSRVQPYGTWFERTFIFPVWTGISARDLALWYRQFATMLSSGMSIVRTLGTLQTTSSGMLRVATARMNRHIEAGGKLSEAMAMFPYIFTRLHRAIIEASEETGALDIMMVRISEYLEADYVLRQMIRKETFMPKINFAATFLLPTLVVWVMHGAGAYFQQAVLPLLAIVSCMLAVYVAGRFALTIRPLAVVYDTVKSYLPYFGNTVRMLALAKFSRALASLFAAGVLIPRAVETASNVAGNEYLSWQMSKSVSEMMAGEGLTESFARTGAFPPMFLSMMKTGETTGSLDITLNKLAEYYEGESAVRLHQSVQSLNVLIFLIVAGIVGFEVVRFWTGYYGGIMSAGDP